MLYVTTRNHQETFTAQHVFAESRSVEDGLFLPLHFPKLSRDDLKKLSELSFNQRVAEMLRLFFPVQLSGWDVDFSVGRYPVRLEHLPHRIILAENWHNPQWQYGYLEKKLSELLSAQTELPGNWMAVAIRMAILAGILADLEQTDNSRVDVAVVTGDFTIPISAYYLRKMGFPVGNLVCCCNENNQFWDLICHGQMKMDTSAVSTIIPEADIALPANLERLICDCGGIDEVMQYAECRRKGTPYSASESVLKALRRDLYVSVISSSRVETAIPNVYKTHEYVLDPASALAYSGLMDYRAKTGITRTAVVICDKSPACSAAVVAECMDLSEEELMHII